MINSDHYKDITLRIVNFKYLKQVCSLLKNSGVMLSNKRLRRCAYLDVHQNNYRSYKLYNSYKKVVNSDAANNQTIAVVIVLGLLSAIISIFIFA